MRQLIQRTASLVIAAAVAAALLPVQAQEATPKANPHAAALADFHKRIEAYQELHRKVAKGEAEMKETSDPAEIRRTEQTLATRLREARKTARQGDIFSPEIRSTFRRLMFPELQGAEGRDTRTVIREDAPAGVRLKVNASYPEGEPHPTVPANLLANLPKLPKDLEYRIVDRHLILLDVDANLIVDYIPNAFR